MGDRSDSRTRPVCETDLDVGAAVAGYLIWDEVPDRWVLAGGLIIIGSGLFIVYREVGGLMTNRYLRVFTAAATATMANRRRRRKADGQS